MFLALFFWWVQMRDQFKFRAKLLSNLFSEPFWFHNFSVSVLFSLVAPTLKFSPVALYTQPSHNQQSYAFTDFPFGPLCAMLSPWPASQSWHAWHIVAAFQQNMVVVGGSVEHLQSLEAFLLSQRISGMPQPPQRPVSVHGIKISLGWEGAFQD